MIDIKTLIVTLRRVRRKCKHVCTEICCHFEQRRISLAPLPFEFGFWFAQYKAIPFLFQFRICQSKGIMISSILSDFLSFATDDALSRLLEALDPGMLLEAKGVDLDEALGIRRLVVALDVHGNELRVVERHSRLAASDVDGPFEAVQRHDAFNPILTLFCACH